jgi:hypothetical protein
VRRRVDRRDEERNERVAARGGDPGQEVAIRVVLQIRDQDGQER